MGHESIRKRRLKSEEIARKDRTRCLVFRRVVGYSGANRAVPDALGWPSHIDTDSDTGAGTGCTKGCCSRLPARVWKSENSLGVLVGFWLNSRCLGLSRRCLLLVAIQYPVVWRIHM